MHISELTQAFEDIVKNLGAEAKVILTHPENLEHGDYTTNVALQLAKQFGRNPKDIAKEIAAELEKHAPIHKAEVAGPGFVNVFLKSEFFTKSVGEILDKQENFGKGNTIAGMRIMYEYTDPNPLKVFHIGHLMSNAIGESLARLAEFSGAKVVRACYQGDVGLHIAKALYGMRKHAASMPSDSAMLHEKTSWLGEAYVAGATAFEENEQAKSEIETINKSIYKKSDTELFALYEKGKRWSLDHFEELYKKLGTKFDRYYFESQIAGAGLELVDQGIQKAVFEISEDATVFKGEQYGLHTRVFVSSQGLPTYECKDLGLNVTKFKDYPDLDRSVIITGNEITEYMRVVMQVLKLLAPSVAEKSEHIPHGMMLGPGGKKMSSRRGGVISGEELLDELESLATERSLASDRGVTPREARTIGERVAVAAIKYSILKGGIGNTIVFDREQALSFEGDSGPYLLYTYARAKSVLKKAKDLSIAISASSPYDWETTELERRLYRLPELVHEAHQRKAPSSITTYLIMLAQTFNSYYGNTVIVKADDAATPYRLALTAAAAQVLHNGLNILGIETLEKM